MQRALLEEGVQVNIMNHGVDVGTDVTAGKRRATTKLKEREQAGRSKAKRVSVLSMIDARCKTLENWSNADQHIRKQCSGG